MNSTDRHVAADDKGLGFEGVIQAHSIEGIVVDTDAGATTCKRMDGYENSEQKKISIFDCFTSVPIAVKISIPAINADYITGIYDYSQSGIVSTMDLENPDSDGSSTQEFAKLKRDINEAIRAKFESLKNGCMGERIALHTFIAPENPAVHKVEMDAGSYFAKGRCAVTTSYNNAKNRIVAVVNSATTGTTKRVDAGTEISVAARDNVANFLTEKLADINDLRLNCQRSAAAFSRHAGDYIARRIEPSKTMSNKE